MNFKSEARIEEGNIYFSDDEFDIVVDLYFPGQLYKFLLKSFFPLINSSVLPIKIKIRK